MNEIRWALRRLRRRPGWGVSAALTVAVGVAAVTAAFAAVDGVLLQDLPVADQDHLVVVWHDNPARDFAHVPFRPAAYDVVARGVTGLVAVAGVESAGARPAAAQGVVGPFLVHHVRVAGDFFGVLGARAAVGRLLTATDDAVGAAPALVMSHALWVSRYGGDPGVVGSTLRYGGRAFTVVGVTPPGFDVPYGTEAWTTLRGAYADWARDPPVDVELDVVGRLAPGADAVTVATELAATLRRDPATAAAYAPLQPVVTGMEEWLVGSQRSVLQVSLAGALLLLLAATANTTVILLASGSTATHDVAVRRALGAGRGHVLGRVMSDAGLVGALGTAGGLGLAWLALRVLVPLAPPELPRLHEVTLSAATAAFALVAGLVATLVAGSAAGLALGRFDARTVLTVAGSGHRRVGGRVRGSAAGLQVAVTVVAAMGAGLLVRTVVAMDRLDAGLDVHRLSLVSLTTPYAWFQVPDAYLGALEQVVRELESRPGIEAARPTLAPPLQRGLEAVLRTEDQSSADARANPYVVVDAVLPGHFRALGIPLLEGRGLTAADNRKAADPVVVVNRAAARTLWPGQDPLGRRVTGVGDRNALWTVVGVVGDTRYRDLLDPRPAAYYPLRRVGIAAPSQLLVRSAPTGPRSVAELVRRVFATADPRVRVLGEASVAEALRRPTVRPRFAAGVLLWFAGTTLLLAGLGVYGVFAVWVQERTAEMGVRRALGAPRGRLVRLVLGGVLRLAGMGAAVGVVGALWAARLVETLLYGVPARDPRTLAGVVVGSVGVALLAGLVPALRAARSDPALSLRAE